MKKTAVIPCLALCILASGKNLLAQHAAPLKVACISFNELLASMPEVKKADTALEQYRAALQQEYDSYQADYKSQLVTLYSRDTLKYNAAQLDLKRRNLSDLFAKIQGYNQQAGRLIDQKRAALFVPIQQKAQSAIRAVSKDNGFTYVIDKDNLQVYPPSDDILPLVKKRLGLP
ncbi:MAG TPA: OmpH family outer membrane protein [Puia sp.]|nr:OmpH family outer membrane protein [Puia sp.]